MCVIGKKKIMVSEKCVSLVKKTVGEKCVIGKKKMMVGEKSDRFF